LTLAINKLDKHATTVFSGVVPSTIEFLQPEKTIETTTDSLRDFIIALDKSKADKLRYKVEDDVVRIFITPYRTTITDKDLEFSQGDFNVDLVVALGVTRRQDLDKAITSHGRILHDATIVALTKREMVSELGAINWQDNQASSLCEMVASVMTELQPEVLDCQMATAFLTGIIAETDRFKNDKTTPLALSLSSKLMTSGANQQLIAEKLDEPDPAPAIHRDNLSDQDQHDTKSRADGELEIDHSDADVDKIHIDDDGNLNLAELNNLASEEQAAPELPAPTEPEATSTDDYSDTPSFAEIPENNQSTDTESSMPENQESQDVGKDLFDDLSSQDNSTDDEDDPTLKQPDSSDTPMMQHEKVITPPAHPDDIPKSDKPFDPREAMAELGVPQQMQPSAPTEVPSVPEVSETPTESSSATGDSLADLEKSVGSTHQSSSEADVVPAFPSPPPELNESQDSVIQAAASQSVETPQVDATVQPISLEPPKVDTGENPQVQLDKDAPPQVPPPMTMSPQFYDADGNNANPFVNPPN
jgi:hypothetical protein